MKVFIGIFLLAFISAGLTETAHSQQRRDSASGLPWAYGFSTPVVTPTSDAQGPVAPIPSQSLVRMCGFCHYPNGKGRPNSASLAGLPASYIVEQLRNFRDGDRKSWGARNTNTNPMIVIARAMSEDEMRAAAHYFSSIEWTPWIKVVETGSVPKSYFVDAGSGLHLPVDGAEAATEPIGRQIVELPVKGEETNLQAPGFGFIAYVPLNSISRGGYLATTGGAGKTIACANCHGHGLMGGDYDVPGIAGRSPSYLARQLYDFQKGSRTDYTQMMKLTVTNLSETDILDIVAYVASLPVQERKIH